MSVITEGSASNTKKSAIRGRKKILLVRKKSKPYVRRQENLKEVSALPEGLEKILVEGFRQVSAEIADVRTEMDSMKSEFEKMNAKVVENSRAMEEVMRRKDFDFGGAKIEAPVNSLGTPSRKPDCLGIGQSPVFWKR